MLRRITWLVCFYLILDYGSGRSTPPSTKIFEVVEIHPSKVVFTLRPFEINVKPFGIENRSYHSVTIPHYGVTTEPGFPMLPATGALIPMPAAGEVTVTILESQFEEISGVHVPPTPYIQEDLQTGQVAYQYLENQPIYASDTFWPSRLAVFSSKGRVRGRLIGRIQVHPVQYNPLRKTLRVYKMLKIQVAFSEPLPGKAKRGRVQLDLIDKLSQSLFLSPQLGFESELRKPTAAVDRQLKGWYNPQFTYYKLFIDEAGVYSLTYDDLVNAGVSVDLLDLNRLKIIHQGQQIPIWIAGPQGQSFSPQNIVYFYGDRHRGSETYYDLYTDTNVYWLTTDGEVGLRYRRVAETNASVNISPFYWETLHVEKEKIFHRANGSSAVDEGEGWIWRYFFDDDREGFDFQVSGRFEAVEVCSIKVRMQGTTKDPVNPDHHVRLSLNNQNIAEAFFDDKDEFIWAVPFPTLLLKEGQNRIELHLVPDTGAQINQIYLDWVEIVYPRAHAALQSTLSFLETNPTGLLTQYSLVNFKDSKVTIFDPIKGKMWQPEAEKISFFRVESAGFDDGKYAKISTEFETLDLKTRGHNLVVVYPQTGETEAHHFDTFASSGAANDMAVFINGLPEGSIVLAGIVDEGSSSMTEAAHQALESLGSALTRQVEFRDSWALIGWKGAPIGTVKETLSRRFDGPAAVADTFRNEQAFRFSGSFEDTASANTFYVGFSSQGVKKVQGIEKDQSSDLRASSNGADYLILTHQDFKGEAERLASYRRDHNGFRTVVVDVQDIYDEFNDGIMNPQAIKDFITYAYQNWQAPAPWFVLLFGDASWDPKKLLTGATKTNFVPSYGILVADNWYVTLDGPDDILPDMFIGRIPVETTEQAAVVVDKIMAYEGLPFAAWNKEFVFLNGGINSTEQSIFLSQANTLIVQQIEATPFNGKATNFNKTTTEGITQSFRRKIADKINQGVLWVNFLGHAGSTVWDIDAGQPEEWQNREIFPFMTGMSCHSARFANPSINSLSESYFIHPMGATAYWGSSGFGYITQDFFLLEGIFTAVARDTVRSVGEATTFAKWHLWQRLGDQKRSRFVINQYTLIGDPAMDLVLPEKPELTVRSGDVKFASNLLLTTDSTTTISTAVQNYGYMPQDSVEILFDVFDAEDNLLPIGLEKMGPFGNVQSVSVTWNLPDKPGAYRVQVEVDPADIIAEEDELNNRAERQVFVYGSDLTLIKPLNFGVVSGSSPVLVTNNSRTFNANLVYFFEIDTSSLFSSFALQQSPPIPEGKLITKWRPQLSVAGVYHWRVRTYDGTNYGPWQSASFSYLPESSLQWQQNNEAQFNENFLDQVVSTENGTVSLQQTQFVYEAQSAGFNDGNHALLWRNNEFFSENKRGHNLAVFDEINGQFLSKSSFDTFEDAANAEAMAQFINDLPFGRIVLAAIQDEGSSSMTENAYLALESIGSALTRQVGFRDSWAIIGRKGAAIGSVPEVLKKSGQGPAAVVDTLFRFAKIGRMISSAIGPALHWKSLHLAYRAAPPKTRLQFNLFGKNRATGQIDSVKTGIAGIEQLDLADIDAQRYPELQVQAVLFSEDGLDSPELESWALDFVPAPDLVLGKGAIHVQADTVSVGTDLELNVEVGNFGLSPADSFAISFFTTDSDLGKTELNRIRAKGIAVDAFENYDAVIPTEGLAGKVEITVEVDAEAEIVELDETNNRFGFNAWVVEDTISPEIRVLFDGRGISDGDFVSANPQIVVEVRDLGGVAFTDTSQVLIFLDEQRVVYGSGPGQAQFIPQQNPDDANLKVISILSPVLTDGEHQIEVIAKDGAQNQRSFQVQFFVSSDFLIANVMNYPNPFPDETEFTYILTQEADQVRLKIYTVSGRLIREIDFLPTRVGFNQFHWNGRDHDQDILANGVYLYKIIARKGDQQVEVIEKFVVMR